jgi:hypothetical protein
MSAVAHRLVLEFRSDGACDLHPETTDPADLARRLAALIAFLIEHPSRIACAAGLHAQESASS